MTSSKNTKALIDLLDDPDLDIYKVVEKELVKKNVRIIPDLEEKWENSLDEICQQRIESLIQYLHLKELKKELKNWVRKDDPSLLHGFYIVNKLTYPDLNYQKIERKIETIRRDVWLELNDSLTSLEKTTVLNHIFFDLHGYSINHSNINSPQNCFLNQVIETKQGNPYSITMLYSIVATLLELPIFFIDFPKNPLLAYFDRKIALEAHGENIDTDIIFYINPANSGSITGRKEVEYHLKKMKMIPDSKFYTKSDNRVFLLRLLSRLFKSYDLLGFTDKAEIVNELKIIISDHLGMNL
jgi:regulator of sirC expression with transglutaminase-like and TPR domain